MKWVTRSNLKVGRVAYPWLIKRFVDHDAEFLFVPEENPLETACREDATPFDAPRRRRLVFPSRVIYDDVGTGAGVVQR